jgi:hypothetical protein
MCGKNEVDNPKGEIMKREVALAMIAVLFSVQICRADDKPMTTSSPEHSLAVAKRDAARKAYEAWWANYRDRAAPGEWVYLWSKRWLRAENELSSRPDDQVAAYQAHLERMRELEGIVTRMQRARPGLARIDELSTTRYYRIEAEIWFQKSRQESQGAKH